MIIKVPVYFEVSGTISDSSALSDLFRNSLEEKLIGVSYTGEYKKTKIRSFKREQLNWLKQFGPVPEGFRIISKDEVLELMRIQS